MLGHEEHIVEHADVPEQEFNRVARYATPVALQVRVDALLRDAQDAAREIQKDLRDAPALGALVLLVVVELGRVLDQRHEQLHVRDGVDDVQPGPGRRGVAARRAAAPHHDGHDDDGEDGAQGHAQDGARGLGSGRAVEAPGAREEVLRGRDDAEEEAVAGEDDVVEGDGGEVARAVAVGVLLADDRGPVEGRVGDEVGEEACRVYVCQSHIHALLRKA